MPIARVERVERNLTDRVAAFSLVRYKIASVLHLLFTAVTIALVLLFLAALFFVDQKFSEIILDHAKAVVAALFGTGGLAAYMARLDHQERLTINLQQALDMVSRMEDGTEKRKAITALALSLAKLAKGGKN